MKNNTIPYFVIFSGEYKVFRTILTEEEMLKVIDKISEISVLGDSSIEFTSPHQELYFEKLLLHYEKNLKTYMSKVNNGKKGGRPKKNKEPILTQSKPVTAYDITCNPHIDKCFAVYKEYCKDLKPIRYERRNRETLDLVAKFLEETQADFDYFKEVCIKANELKVICDNAIDFKSVIKNHIAISNEKFKKDDKNTVVTKLKFK